MKKSVLPAAGLAVFLAFSAAACAPEKEQTVEAKPAGEVPLREPFPQEKIPPQTFKPVPGHDGLIGRPISGGHMLFKGLEKPPCKPGGGLTLRGCVPLSQSEFKKFNIVITPGQCMDGRTDNDQGCPEESPADIERRIKDRKHYLKTKCGVTKFKTVRYGNHKDVEGIDYPPDSPVPLAGLNRFYKPQSA